MKYLRLLCAVLVLLTSCQPNSNNDTKPLPVIKESIAPFSLVNQDGDTITNANFEGKIYITDFFFTSCPAQCPKMKREMLRMLEKYKDNDDVVLLSHSIDTRNDSVPVLKDYAEKLGVAAPKWQFVTASRQAIKDCAKDYYIAAQEDKEEPGGYLHSSKFVVVDWKGQMRTFCDGLMPKEVDELMVDIDNLLDEKAKEEAAKG